MPVSAAAPAQVVGLAQVHAVVAQDGVSVVTWKKKLGSTQVSR
jgi:hypothetical protein